MPAENLLLRHMARGRTQCQALVSGARQSCVCMPLDPLVWLSLQEPMRPQLENDSNSRLRAPGDPKWARTLREGALQALSKHSLLSLAPGDPLMSSFVLPQAFFSSSSGVLTRTSKMRAYRLKTGGGERRGHGSRWHGSRWSYSQTQALPPAS